MRARAEAKGYRNGTKYNSLTSQMLYGNFLPTPQANCSKGMNPENVELRGNKMYNKKTGKQIQSSPEQWAKMGLLPTPNTMDSLPPKEGEAMERIANGARKGRKSPSNLREYVNPKSWEAYSATKMITQETGKPSQLNPHFVEEMMGFPKNWTVSPFQNGEESQSKHTETP
jgi:hypothetical protein